MRRTITGILIAALLSACTETRYIIVTESENDGGFRTTGMIVQDHSPQEPLPRIASLEEDGKPINWDTVEEYLIATGYLATLTVLLVLSASAGNGQ